LTKNRSLDHIWPELIQKYKTHDNSNLQPARAGQFNLAKFGQGQWLFQYVFKIDGFERKSWLISLKTWRNPGVK
jgi:deferrochelatase/peroxidase EfeB